MKRSTIGMLSLVGVVSLAAGGCGGSGGSGATRKASVVSAPPGAAHSEHATGEGTSAGTAVTVKHAAKLGTILAAGPNRMTVYLFEADSASHSACSGACAQTWPPVTTSGKPQALSGAKATDLGTIARADGTMQVTYNGHPLYYFVKDKDSGDAYGAGIKGFGAGWYALKPSGAKLDNS